MLWGQIGKTWNVSKHIEQELLFPKAVKKFIQHTWQEEQGARIKHMDCFTSSFSSRKILIHWREFVDMEAISVLFLGIFFSPLCAKIWIRWRNRVNWKRDWDKYYPLNWSGKKPHLIIQMESRALWVNAEGSASAYVFI